MFHALAHFLSRYVARVLLASKRASSNWVNFKIHPQRRFPITIFASKFGRQTGKTVNQLLLANGRRSQSRMEGESLSGNLVVNNRSHLTFYIGSLADC